MLKRNIRLFLALMLCIVTFIYLNKLSYNKHGQVIGIITPLEHQAIFEIVEG